jgi:hypothetical protein
MANLVVEPDVEQDEKGRRDLPGNSLTLNTRAQGRILTHHVHSNYDAISSKGSCPHNAST